MVGCYAHLLNLGCKRYFDASRPALDKIHKLMTKLRCRDSLRRYVQHWTGEMPKTMCLTRWRSMAQMLESYVKVRFRIPFDEVPELLPLRLSHLEDKIADTVLFNTKTDLLTVFDLLESSDSTLGLARTWFDDLLSMPAYSQCMREYLSTDSSLLTAQSRAFITAVANLSLPQSRQRPLNADEMDSIDMFRNSGEVAPNGRFRRTLEEPAAYPSLSWVPATTCVVERLFSVAQNMLPYNRLSIDAKNFENQLLVGIFNSSISARAPDKRPMDPITSLSDAVQSIYIK